MEALREEAKQSTAQNVKQLPGRSKRYTVTKRIIDIVLSLIASLVLLIPLCLLSGIIICKDFGNPFFTQIRIGKDGKPFRIFKLRSMKKGSEHLDEMLTKEQLAEYRNEYKLNDDSRLIGWKKQGDGTRCFGALLRRTSMDELPQILFNICIMGNMAIVGPRPILPEELMRHYSAEDQKILLSVKPGLTGYWQAYARNNASYNTGERQKMELFYAQNADLLWDIKIFFSTFEAVLRKQGAK